MLQRSVFCDRKEVNKREVDKKELDKREIRGDKMLLEQAIMEVLKRHSSMEKTSDTKPLKGTEITKYLIEDFPEEHRSKPITNKRVRTALDNIINSELSKDDKDKSIRYTVYERKGEEYKTSYWTPKSISDVELKYLIDSVMYSKIFDSETAQDFAGRIQQLSGKNLYRMTAYAGSAFGRQRLTINVNVLENMQIIMEAEKKNAFISFDWNVYDVNEKNIGLQSVGSRTGKPIILKKIGSHTVKPVHIILSDGRYFMLARYRNCNKIYHFSIDLMSGIVIKNKIRDDVKAEEYERDFNRAKYMLQHPYNMGGKAEHFKLRVKRKFLSRVVDTFSYEIEVIPNSVTETTVDIKVSASLEGIKRWLLFHYDIAEILEPGEELKKMLAESAEVLWGRYCKSFQ